MRYDNFIIAFLTFVNIVQTGCEVDTEGKSAGKGISQQHIGAYLKFLECVRTGAYKKAVCGIQEIHRQVHMHRTYFITFEAAALHCKKQVGLNRKIFSQLKIGNKAQIKTCILPNYLLVIIIQFESKMIFKI